MNRSLRQLLQDAAAGRDVSARARELLTAKRRGPAKALPGESRQAKRERRHRQHAEETAAIRDACVKRADGRCEVCGQAEDQAQRRGPLEMHHLLGGVGRRRQKQAIENCMMVCDFCHHAVPARYLACNVEAWCKRYGYPVPEPVRKHVEAVEADAVAAGRAAGGTP